MRSPEIKILGVAVELWGATWPEGGAVGLSYLGVSLDDTVNNHMRNMLQ